jgi:chromosome segregation protein
LTDSLSEAERLLERLTSELAEWHARKHSLERSREVAAALAETSTQQLEAAQERLDDAISRAAEMPDVRAAESAAEEARTLAATAREALSSARAKLESTEAAEAATRAPLEVAERHVQALSAEAKALADLLRPQGQDLFPPLVDAVVVQSGYEAAFAAALGDDLQAPLDETSPHHWRNLGPLEAAAPLPGDARPLTDFVDAPPALARRLAMTGLVSEETGKALQATLRPGQRLVTQRGDLWRWDGYAASADAPSPAAIRLSQRNRLTALESEIALGKETRAAAFAHFSEAKALVDQAREDARASEQNERRAEQSLIAAQDHAAKVARAAAERASQLASFEAEIRRLGQARDAAHEAEEQAIAGLAELADGASLAESVANARSGTADARGAHAEARAALDALRRDGEIRTQRLSRHRGRNHTLAKPARSGRPAHCGIESPPRRNAQRTGCARRRSGRDRAQARCVARYDRRRGSVPQRSGGRPRDRRTQSFGRRQSAKAADSALSAAREERARSQAILESAQGRIDELRTRIRDELDATPEELVERAEIKEGQELPDLEHADKRVEKLKQEREQLGGVNLRAEEEAAEHSQRLETLHHGPRRPRRRDPAPAPRHPEPQREGRERLLESFEKVNTNFQLLFTKLFEGGEAKLTFTESEDPLEAGLEIFARPPGKRLQSLSLLSGGEQALTALALIFAVFLVNPAPVCVLDEVDAPLDDANVERFCNLLDEMTKLTDTRFLVITHHALTMSRMHRLFGVTMAERGVSQLVSVTLAEAERVAAAE